MSRELPLPKILLERARFRDLVRDFFRKRNVLEVDPLALLPAPPIDANIEVMEVEIQNGEKRYLHTSPEYAMKEYLSLGAPDIYYLGHVFRKEEKGRLHSPEFTMIEWYRHHFSLKEMIEETCALLSLFFGPLPQEVLSYESLFPPSLSLPSYTNSWSEDEKLDYYLTHSVQDSLGKGKFTIILDFPPSQAALAKTVEKEGKIVAKRFEIYHEGIEMANGYEELSDPQILQERFARENENRKQRNQSPYPLPYDFLDAMRRGLPPCSGVSVGFDRALLVALQLSHIDDLIPVIRNNFAFGRVKAAEIRRS